MTVSKAKFSNELVEGDILLIRVAQDTIIEEKDIILAQSIIRKKLKGQKIPFVIVFEDFSSISADARVLISSPKFLPNRSHEAIVVRSMAQTIVANFYLRNKENHVVSQLFKEEKEAIAWAKSVAAEAVLS